MPLPTPVYTSGDFSIVMPLEIPDFRAPFDGVDKRYVLTQRFSQNADSFQPLALNTPYHLSGIYGISRFSTMFDNVGFNPADFLLVGESNFERIGTELRWDRTYAAVPESRQEATQFNFTYPGLQYNTGVLREPVTDLVSAVLVSDYFLIGTATIGSILAIPKIDPFRIFFKYPDLPNGELDDTHPSNTAYLSTNLLNLTRPTSNLDVTEGGVAYKGYIPFLESYKNKVRTNQPITIADLLVAQSSEPRRWLGNIFERQTIYVPPK